MNKEKNKPVLSLCIPTYNRSAYLRKTIDSIISNPIFQDGKIEVVVSDNASTDDTENIVRKYCSQYTNIHYSKNEDNIRDRNFPKVLLLANGIYRKLINDTLIFNNETLSIILEKVEENIKERPVLLFSNENVKRINSDSLIFENLNSFIEVVSFWSTWIGLFGIWEEDLSQLSDKYEGCDLCLWQTNTLFILLSKKKSVIYNKKIFTIQEVQKKDLSYGVFNVFGINYLSILEKYLNTNKITYKTFNLEKKILLLKFFLPWKVNYILRKQEYVLSMKEDNTKILKELYSKYWYYRLFYFKVYYTVLLFKISKFRNTFFRWIKEVWKRLV